MNTKLRETVAVPPDRETAWPERIRAGQVDAFGEMFEAYHTRLCLFADGYVRCPETAKEIVSDVFMRIWENRAEWRVTGSVSGYLFAAVRNGAMDHVRHRRVRDRVHAGAVRAERSPGMGQPLPGPEEELRAREMAELVRRTIERLPPRAREAFLLQRRRDLSYAQVAEEMGISVGTVEKHISRAIAALRERLGREEGRRP